MGYTDQQFERDVRSILKGKETMRAKDLIRILIDKLNYKDTDSTRTYVYSSLGKWCDEGWMSRVGRGTYKMV